MIRKSIAHATTTTLLAQLYMIGILFGIAQADTCPQITSSLIGTYVPQCNGKRWNEVQCHGSIGYCWCVDSDTGRKLGKTPQLDLDKLVC